MTSTRLLILALLAASVILVFSALFVAVDVLGLRTPQVEQVGAEVITATPQPSYTRPPSSTPLPSATPTRSPIPTLTNAPAVVSPAAKLSPTGTRRIGTLPRKTSTPVLKKTATPARSPSLLPTSSPTASPTATPTARLTNAGLEFVSVSTAAPGGDAQVTIKTSPGRICSLGYISTSGMYLEPPRNLQRADVAGGITWVWKFPADALPGQGRVIVICGQTSVESSITIESN